MNFTNESIVRAYVRSVLAEISLNRSMIDRVYRMSKNKDVIRVAELIAKTWISEQDAMGIYLSIRARHEVYVFARDRYPRVLQMVDDDMERAAGELSKQIERKFGDFKGDKK